MKEIKVLEIKMTEEEYEDFLKGNVTGFIFNFTCPVCEERLEKKQSVIDILGSTMEKLSKELLEVD